MITQMSLAEQEVLIALSNHPGVKMKAFDELRRLESAGFVRLDDEGCYWLTHGGVEVASWLKIAKARL